MDIGNINKQIQAERNRHQQKINNLKTEITKENEHSRRTIEYLQRQKQQATKLNANENIYFAVNDVLKKFL